MSALQIIALIWTTLTLIGLVGIIALTPIVDKNHPNALKTLWRLFWRCRKKYKLWVLATIFTPFSFNILAIYLRELLNPKGEQ